MKKLYNKALLYQSIYTGKWAIFGGAFFFFLIVKGSLDNRIELLRSQIGSMVLDKLILDNSNALLMTCLILFGVYVLTTGFNKRNTKTFLTSGPFTKEEIKKNELMVLIGTLFLLVIIYIYVTLCLYYKERELLVYASSYWQTLFVDILRITVAGLGFISYLTFMDMLFSNIIVAIISMYLMPTILLINLMDHSRFIWLFIEKGILKNIFIKIENVVNNISTLVSKIFLWGNEVVNGNYYKDLILIILLVIIVSIGLFILGWFINKRTTINKMNKFFTFPIVEKVTLWIISYTIIFTFISRILREYIQRNYIQKGLNINNLVGVIIVILTIGFSIWVSTYLQKNLRKLINKFI
ncbi:hypothetical protein [Clostridium sp. LP20]|uniref:hypothetical protein n=1 Tax=Clostridium sp. LP20 TaxID=3418665 RepID=UPI003EE734C2